jgi:hypothetical protein
MRRFLGAMFRRLPPVVRRDERIRELKRRIATHDAQKGIPPTPRPSYRAMVHSERRMSQLDRPSASVIKHGKFYVYDVARSHGIEIPQQFGRWTDPRDIPWDELPDHVVIKSMRGRLGRGVLPLRRAAGGWQIISHDGEVLTGEHLAERLNEQVRAGRIRGPFGAEEFLDEDGTGTRPPTNVNLYTCYGETVFAMLRRVDRHGDPADVFRIVDRRGQDVGDTYSGKSVTSEIDVPARLGDMFDVAERLSMAIRASFSRIDMYGIGDRIVFGEITPRPGGPQWFGPHLDAELGAAWERAQVRLSRDLASGSSPEFQMGPIPIVDGGADAVPNEPSGSRREEPQE